MKLDRCLSSDKRKRHVCVVNGMVGIARRRQSNVSQRADYIIIKYNVMEHHRCRRHVDRASANAN